MQENEMGEGLPIVQNVKADEVTDRRQYAIPEPLCAACGNPARLVAYGHLAPIGGTRAAWKPFVVSACCSLCMGHAMRAASISVDYRPMTEDGADG